MKRFLIAAWVVGSLAVSAWSQDLLQQGRQFQARGDFPRARACYEEALKRRSDEQGPQSESAQAVLIALAELYRAQEKYRQALECLTRATRIGEQLGQNDDAQLLRRLGVCELQCRLTSYEAARSTIDEVVAEAQQRWGEDDTRTHLARTVQSQVYRRLHLDPSAGADPPESLRDPESTASPSPETAVGTVGVPVPDQLGVYHVQTTRRLEPGRPVRVVRDGQTVARGIINQAGDLNLIGTQALQSGDLLLAQPEAPPAKSEDPHLSHGYRQAEQRFRQRVSSGKLKLSKNTSYLARVQDIGQKLAAASKRNIPWNFFVVESDYPNAYSYGEGFVALTTGLMQLQLTDDELAGVLAHEIAHGTEQHAQQPELELHLLEQAAREYEEAQALLKRYEQEDRQSSHASGLDSKLATVKRRVSEADRKLKYCLGRTQFQTAIRHEQEVEADIVGLRYAVAAGYKPEGHLQALQKMLRHVHEESDPGYTGEGKTHPSVQRRIEIMQKVLSTWRAP